MKKILDSNLIYWSSKLIILNIDILRVEIKVEMHYISDWNIKLEYLRLDKIGINTQNISWSFVNMLNI